MENSKQLVNVHHYFSNKVLFLTGCTGFIGKVILEKILWCFPDIKTIFLLVRGKKGQTINDRFYNNVIKSACFNRLRNRHGSDFDKFVNSKCSLIEGDLIIDKLGMTPENEQLVINNVQIMMNSAASIDFTASLDANIEINVFGALRVFELAKKVKNLENFLHISTAYSNSNIKGEIEEKVYPLNDDPMRVVQEIMSLPKELLLKNTKKYLGKFPNTYTYTKNLFEQMLYKEKGKYPIVILRPTIVGAAMRDPAQGWTDAISAAGALFMLGGLGLLSFVPGSDKLVLDQIPVDFVVDYLLVATAVYAKDLQFNVIHCGTSQKNPYKFIWINDEIWEYWKLNPSSKQIIPPRFYIVTNKLVYKLKNIKRMGESYLYIWFIQRFGTIEQKKQLTRFKKMIAREQKVCKEFEYFMTIDFCFKMNKCDELENSITMEERKEFLLDPQIINWNQYLWNFLYGIQIYILKEDAFAPDDISQRNALKQNPLKPRDIENYLMPGQQTQQVLKVSEMISRILTKPEIALQLNGLSQIEHKHVESICQQMFADQNFDILKRFARSIQKLFKRVFTQIIVDENKINQLRILEKSGKNLVIVSNHLSYADFVILTYIFYAYSLKCPFVNSVQDFLGIPLLTQIFRYGGAFFTERKSKHFTQLYSMILSEYMRILLNEGSNIEFFIENSRTRSGKLTAPNNPTYDLFIQTALKHENADNILIVPVSVTYEKVIEQDAFTFELLGEEKPKEGIWRLLKWVTHQITECGRVNLGIGEPIGIKQIYNQEIVHQPLMNSIANLSMIMPTSMVASIMLMYRKGISSENLTNKCDWLSHQLSKRSLKIASISQSTPLISVPKAISYFDDILIKNKEIFSLAVKPKEEYKAILLLAYYRNALLNQLFKEAKAACSLVALSALNQVIPSTELHNKIIFLDSLFKNEFIDAFEGNIVEKMIELEMISSETSNNEEQLKCKDVQMITFLNSLILPFIESYWCALISLYQLKKHKEGMKKQQIIEQIQWLAEQLYDEKLLNYYESCSLDSLKQAFKAFLERNIIQKDPQTKFYKLIIGDQEYIELEKQIRFYLVAQSKTSATPFEIAKLVLGEFPIVSKL